MIVTSVSYSILITNYGPHPSQLLQCIYKHDDAAMEEDDVALSIRRCSRLPAPWPSPVPPPPGSLLRRMHLPRPSAPPHFGAVVRAAAADAWGRRVKDAAIGVMARLASRAVVGSALSSQRARAAGQIERRRPHGR